MRTLKSMVEVGDAAATAAASFFRRAASLMFGLWQRTQYSTRLRRFPCTENPFENSPWHEKQFWFSTTMRRGTTAPPSSPNDTTGFTAASFTEIDSVSWTGRRASAPTVQVPVASAGIGVPVTYSKTPDESGPFSVPLAPPPTAVSCKTWA